MAFIDLGFNLHHHENSSPVTIIRVTTSVNIFWRIFIIMKIPLNNPFCVLVHTFSDDGILFFHQAGLDPDVIEAFDMGTSTEMEC